MDFDRQLLEEAFAVQGQMAHDAGKVVEIAVYRGSALVLTLPGRVATKDVDAVFQSDAAWMRNATATIAAARGWAEAWLNDAVKGYLSARDSAPDAKRLFKTYPAERPPGLRVYVASPRYLFAMKCLAMRIAGIDQTRDRADIEALGSQIGVKSAADALEIVSAYYPHSQISPKTRFGIEEIFGPADGGAREQPT